MPARDYRRLCQLAYLLIFATVEVNKHECKIQKFTACGLAVLVVVTHTCTRLVFGPSLPCSDRWEIEGRSSACSVFRRRTHSAVQQQPAKRRRGHRANKSMHDSCSIPRAPTIKKGKESFPTQTKLFSLCVLCVVLGVCHLATHSSSSSSC